MPDGVEIVEPSAIGAPPSLSVGRVALTVHDLDMVVEFYRRVIGLHRIPSAGGATLLGAGGRALLELRPDPVARRSSPREAGLFHTAFLLPNRAALAAWFRHAAAIGQIIGGASDHDVSEALYLSDPEGNGVEIYADRPAEAWRRSGSTIHMPSHPLDLAALMAADDRRAWNGLAAATIGHVHLQVGSIPQAERFYADELGLGITARYPGGTFYAGAGYHHHLATNVWNSHGAPPRDSPVTGLAALELLLSPADIRSLAARLPSAVPDEAGGLLIRDPWNTAITLTPTHTEEIHHA